MLGAIAGDILGSRFERYGVKSKDFPLFPEGSRFTDDTVLTIACADWLMRARDDSFAPILRDWAQRYPDAGYGGTFYHWMKHPSAGPYGSWGNGSAMRVAPVGWVAQTVDEVLELARRSAEVTHDHPEGIKGAQAVALAVFLARTGADKPAIRQAIEAAFGYDLSRSLDAIRPGYEFDVSCQGSVPEALIAFFDATDFEDAVRGAISLGGDADTQAAMAGAVAEAFYGGVPQPIRDRTLALLDGPTREVVDRFARHLSTGRAA